LLTKAQVRLDSGMFQELLAVVKTLREKCPWDRKQTVATTRPLMLNEAYELDDALSKGDKNDIAEELGDYLFMGIFLANVLEQEQGIRLSDVLGKVVEKLKRRHPHVYGNVRVRDEQEVLQNWERIKRTERETGSEAKSILDGLPETLPALKQAQLIQERCHRVGFDWTVPDDVLNKVVEEVVEVKDELRVKSPDEKRVAEEIGDLFFALVNFSRHSEIDAETVLRDANAKFIRRFKLVEHEFAQKGRNLENVTLEEMDEVWERIKHKPE